MLNISPPFGIYVHIVKLIIIFGLWHLVTIGPWWPAFIYFDILIVIFNNEIHTY